jgi:hypothetical protein
MRPEQPISVDLNEYIHEDTTALNTRTWGIMLRNASKIDEKVDKLGKHSSHIEILMPKHITSVATPFLEEFLGKTIITVGGNRSELLDRIKLVCEGREVFKPYLEDAIKRVGDKELAWDVS